MNNFYKITQKNKKYYYLSVVSKKAVFPDRQEENNLEKIAKKYSGVFSGTGSCFFTGNRDYGFMFPTKAKAARFAKEAFTKKIIRAKMNIAEYVLDWDSDQGKEVTYKNIA